jgi:hypothetical protein
VKRISRIYKSLFGTLSAPAKFALEPGEHILYEGSGATSQGLFGGEYGPLILTNRRVLWYLTHPSWPGKQPHRQMRLDEIQRVDKGNFLNLILRANILRIRTKRGRTVIFYEGENKLDWWVKTIRDRIESPPRLD